MEDGKDFCILPSRVNKITGHAFQKKTFKKPTYCHHCSEFLWGVALQGVKCMTCHFVSHDKCEPHITIPCTAMATNQVQIPRTHALVKLADDKKKFCNVCRLKLEESESYECDTCSYFIHNSCIKKMVHNCKTYCSHTGNFRFKQQHHWCEGHLPINSKCKVCGKVCANVECLTGLRCSWCLVTVHSVCVSKFLNQGSSFNCSFGVLRPIMLAPEVVKRFQFNATTWDLTYPGMSPKNCRCRFPSEKSGDRSPEKHRSVSRERSSGHCSRSVLVYQGSIDDENKILVEVEVSECMSTADCLAESLRKFKIDDERENFYLAMYRYGKTEVKLDEEEKLWTYMDESVTTSNNNSPSGSTSDDVFDDEETPSFFLRNVSLDKTRLQLVLHAGLINTNTKNITLEVNLLQPTIELVLEALKLFKLPIDNPEMYCIAWTKLSSYSIHEVVFNHDETIYDVLIARRKLSIQELRHTRFYLQPKADENSPLFVFLSNLPQDLSENEYRTLLTEGLGQWDDRTVSIPDIFPALGSLVLELSNLKVYEEYSNRLVNLVVEEKPVKTLLLDQIKVDLMPWSSSPLIVFVNTKSGGGQGHKIHAKLKRLLNPCQVVDIMEDGPLPMLYMLRDIPKFQILVCGGDGTAGWVLSSLEDIQHKLKCKGPATAVLPLGTGNDLARVLKWGAGYTGEGCLDLLKQVMSAKEVKLDRWNVVFETGKSGPESNAVTMNNYFGVGLDAQLSLEFHLSREEKPEKFNSRFRNKMVYFEAGVKKLHSSNMSNLHESLKLNVDGQQIPLPPLEGVAVNNISSWAAGADPWGTEPSSSFKPQSFSDGLLEVIGFTGVIHMGKIKTGVSTGIRIAQGSVIEMQIMDSLPVQVDGEPWMQDPCTITISISPHNAWMLFNAKPSKPTRRSSTPTQVDKTLIQRTTTDPN